MSLEKSMADLADANNKLAEANDKLADANINAAKLYAQLIERLDGAQIDTGAVPPAATEDKPRRGRPAKDKAPEPAAEPDNDDGLGGDDDVPQRTSDDVKALLKKFKEAGGVPREIMAKFGAKAFPEIKEADFNAAYEATEKALAKL